MYPQDENLSEQLQQSVAEQGNLSHLDSSTKEQSGKLQSQSGGGPNGALAAALPLIWGSIRILSVYGKWSFWRKPKRA